MAWLFVLFVIGAGLPLQAFVNARLGMLTAGSLDASTLSILISLIVALALLLLQRPALPPFDQLLRFPLWIWVGGVIGGCYVIAATLGVPRIGAAGFLGLVVLGQMIGSLIVDHYGILHPAQPASGMRIFGVVLVTAGMLLVLQPWRR